MSRAIRGVLAWGVNRGLVSRAGLSRRDFMRGAGAAVVAGVVAGGVSCTDTRRRGVSSGGGPVVVIGAGLAGLACADELQREGVGVVVLEAEGRVGGRVDTDWALLPGAAVERGGHLIGRNHPTWLAMAKRHKLNLYEVQGDEGEQALQINGRLLRGKDAERVYTAVDDAVAKIARVAAEISDPVRPWTSEGAAGLDRTSYEEFVLSITSDADTRALLMLGSESDNGVPASRTSLLGYLAMVKGGGLAKYYTDSEIFACTEGNDALASRLAEGLGDRVRLSEAVTRVDLERGAVWTASGKRYPETGSASCVVLAIPSTRWGEIEFEPGLPGGLTPQMGRNMKVMTVSRTRPWKAAGVRSEVMGEKRVTTTWIGAATESEVALTLFSGGRHAGELASLPGGDRIPTALSDASELMPGLSAASERAAVYDWINDPRTRGSYHFPAPGEVTAMGPTLVNGFEGGRVGLRFAGEGMSYAFMGYMEGALSSGIRTARELITSKGLAGMHS